jgi:hypothetical protein
MALGYCARSGPLRAMELFGPEGAVYKREPIEEFNKLKKEVAKSYKEKNPKTIIEQ